MSRLIIGITGGIGSGKTAVSNRFQALGITIADADLAARAVVQPGSKLLSDIAAHFGRDILTGTGELNRPKLRGIVFADTDARRFLERATHGPIMDQLSSELVRRDQSLCHARVIRRHRPKPAHQPNAGR